MTAQKQSSKATRLPLHVQKAAQIKAYKEHPSHRTKDRVSKSTKVRKQDHRNKLTALLEKPTISSEKTTALPPSRPSSPETLEKNDTQYQYDEVLDLRYAPMPERNYYLIAARVARAKRGKKNDTNADDDNDGDEEELLPGEPSDLVYSGAVAYFDNSIERRRSANRAMCATMYAVKHCFSEETVAKLTLALHSKNLALKGLTRSQIMRWQYSSQHTIQAILLQGTKDTIEAMGGIETWKASTLSQRIKVFRRIFQSSPLSMAQASLGDVATAVPLQDIFFEQTPAHIKWQNFYRAVFALACEDIFTYRLSGKVDNSNLCFRKWRNMTTDDQFKQLDLGAIDDIPVKQNSVFDADRREKMTKSKRDVACNAAFVDDSE